MGGQSKRKNNVDRAPTPPSKKANKKKGVPAPFPPKLANNAEQKSQSIGSNSGLNTPDNWSDIGLADDHTHPTSKNSDTSKTERQNNPSKPASTYTNNNVDETRTTKTPPILLSTTDCSIAVPLIFADQTINLDNIIAKMVGDDKISVQTNTPEQFSHIQSSSINMQSVSSHVVSQKTDH